MRLPSVALDSGIHARMTGLIVQYLKTNILPEVINTFTVSIYSGDTAQEQRQSDD
jgi:hypothetical protein